jgi:hypothetical protein
MLGTTAYKSYFNGMFGTRPKYISSFVEMEFTRSFLCSLIDFYFILKLPTLPTIAEAINFASNEFASSKLKAALQLSGQLFQTRKIPTDSRAAKSKALFALAEIIIRIQSNFHHAFINAGKDSTKCARAAIRFEVKLQEAEAGFQKFTESFYDTTECRRKCIVDKFFLKRHRKPVENYINQSKQLKSSPETDGFKKIANNLEKIVSTAGKACSCRMCGSIGDAVISLECEKKMILHHVDQSFNQLCSLINQPHKKHPSENAMVKQKVGE